jgi:hypothetical protein
MKSAGWFSLYISLLCILTDEIDLYAVATLEQQRTVPVGGTVTLPCQSKLSMSVDWLYHKSPFDSPAYVFSNDKVYNGFKSRFSVTRPTLDDYGLTIGSSSLNDTGLYTCAEDGSNGPRHTVSLIVVTEKSATPHDSGSSTGCTIAIIVLVVIACAEAVAFTLFCLMAKKNHTRINKGHEGPTNNKLGSHADEENRDEQVELRGLSQEDGDGDKEQQELPLMSPVLGSSNSEEASNKPNSDSSVSEEASNKPSNVGLPIFTSHGSTDRGNKVRGICVLGDILYVIREGQSEVQMYNRLSLKLTGTLPVSSDKYPGCMTLDSVDKCLYITYYKSQTIRRVPLDGKNVTEWKTSSEPDGICVAANSRNVIVALREADRVVEFSPGGAVVKKIQLPQETNPRSVWSTPDDKLYLCVGYSSGHFCVLGNDGKLNRIETKTDHPLGIAIDHSGNFLVADYNGGKMVVLDSSMNYVCEVTPQTERVKCPFKLCFDDKCEILYVGELVDNGRVLAYCVKYTN